MRKIAMFALVGIVVGGCSSNPTNEPSDKEINDAVARRNKHIDDNPNMTAEDKARMKEHLGRPVGGPDGPGKR